MAKIKWAGDNLKRLLAPLDSQEFNSLLGDFPHLTRATLRRMRNKKIGQAKEGKLKIEGSRDDFTLTDDIVPADPELQAEQLASAKKQIKKLQQKYDSAIDGTQQYCEALRVAFREATEDIKLHVPKAQHVDYKNDADEEIAVICISDMQLGKVTSSYNMDVCEDRMRLLAEKIIRISKIQATHHPVRKLHIQLLGDIVEGENIFPNQAYQIAAGNYRQMNRGWGILVEFILTMLGHFETVHVTGVVGNHGRISGRGGDIDPETNMDRMLYDRLRGTFDSPVNYEPRVSFVVPDGTGLRSWYAVDRIGKWGFLLCHGDQINGWAGIPFYGTQKKALGWIDAIEEPWDYLMMGHFHTPTMLTYNRREVYYNGSTESTNEFAQEKIGAIGFPSQNLFFVHPDNGITAYFKVRLQHAESNLERAGIVARTFA